MQLLSHSDLGNIRRRIKGPLHPYMERALEGSQGEIKAYASGSIIAISWLDVSMVVIDTGDCDSDISDVSSFLSTARWSSLLAEKRTADRLSILDAVKEDRILFTVSPDSLIENRTHTVRRLEGNDDFLSLVHLYQRIEGMAAFYPDEEAEDIAGYYSMRHYPFLAAGAFCDGQLISAGYISAGTPRNAMIAGVATDSRYRNRGYASSVVSELCSIAFSKGMERLSLWPEPEAEHLYRALGFRDDGWYTMFRRN